MDQASPADLCDIGIAAKMLGYPSLGQFFARSLQPPIPETVSECVQQMQDLQVLDDSEHLTLLGSVLSVLPISPSLGKMVLLGLVFKSLDQAVTLASFLSSRDPFDPHASGADLLLVKKRWLSAGSPSHQSDHLVYLALFQGWLDVRSKKDAGEEERLFCQTNLVSSAALHTVYLGRKQIYLALVKLGMLEAQDIPGDDFRSTGSPFFNSNADCQALLMALLSAGLYPNVAEHSRKRVLRTKSEHLAVWIVLLRYYFSFSFHFHFSFFSSSSSSSFCHSFHSFIALQCC